MKDRNVTNAEWIGQLDLETIECISQILQVSSYEIENITALKRGMTNCSFLFSCRNIKYIIRVPGEGTDQLIDRKQEAQVYQAIADKGLCDNVVYINPNNGYKITKFLEGVRVCNPNDEFDVSRCMEKLRNFHNMKLKVAHEFDLFGQIAFYESLWDRKPSVYGDYQKTKKNVWSLMDYIDKYAASYCLTHIDAVPDNFLFYVDETGTENLQLTDWEYAGMQDPHVDIAMFCIYSSYNRGQIDRLIDIYFENCCPQSTRIKIYCYIAVCGLLWSNWCEYKRHVGVEFGEYALCQYEYAKGYYQLAKREMEISNEQGG